MKCFISESVKLYLCTKVFSLPLSIADTLFAEPSLIWAEQTAAAPSPKLVRDQMLENMAE